MGGISPKEALPPAKPLSQVLRARGDGPSRAERRSISIGIEGMAEFKGRGLSFIQICQQSLFSSF